MTSSGGSTIPHLFRCPISLDLFTDPVTLCTGQTYDRPNIERWLAAGNLVCPVTMQRLRDPSLVPNHTLRHLINTWLLSATAVPVDNNGCGSEDLKLGALKCSLLSPDTSMESKLHVLGKVRLITLESDTGQSCLIQLGFVPLLMNLLFSAHGLSSSPEFVEVAFDCLLGLASSPGQMAHLNVLREQRQGSSSSNSPTLANMIQLFESGNERVKTRICRLLEMVMSSPFTQPLGLLIGQHHRVQRTLADLLSRTERTSNCSSNTLTGASDAAVRALSSLCAAAEPAQVAALQEGALDGIVTYLSSGGSCVGAALATVERLVMLESGMRRLLDNPNGVRVLVKMVFRVSAPDDGGSEHAVRALLLACCGSPTARAEAVNAGLLSQLLLLLQSQCGSKAKSEARALLKLLRFMWADEATQRRG